MKFNLKLQFLSKAYSKIAKSLKTIKGLWKYPFSRSKSSKGDFKYDSLEDIENPFDTPPQKPSRFIPAFVRSFLKKISSQKKSFSKKSFSIKSKNQIFYFLQNHQDSLNKIVHFAQKRRVPLIILFVAFLASDLLIISYYKYILPEKEIAPLQKTSFISKDYSKNYSTIWETNIFHEGAIPVKLSSEDKSFKDPVRTKLKMKLKGTIVHLNPRLSIASIEGKDGEVRSYKKGDVIDRQAKVTQVERGKVIFFNQNNNRLEFTTLPKDDKINISYKKPKKPAKQKSASSVVERKGNNFQVKRSDINSHLDNLPDVLSQALVIPHRVNKGGKMVIEGYAFSEINEGSIYEDLGFQVGDIIKTVNGEPVTSPQRALDLFEQLKTSSGIKILVERDGKEVEYEYGVQEDAPISD